MNLKKYSAVRFLVVRFGLRLKNFFFDKILKTKNLKTDHYYSTVIKCNCSKSPL